MTTIYFGKTRGKIDTQPIERALVASGMSEGRWVVCNACDAFLHDLSMSERTAEALIAHIKPDIPRGVEAVVLS